MATKTEAAAAERKVMERYESRLVRAVAYANGYEVVPDTANEAAGILAVLKASASALFPGAQKRKHVLPALGVMVTAACRVIRRGGGK